MTKLLFIQASPRSTESKSPQIARAYLEVLCAETSDLDVDTLDLWEAGLPTFNGDKAAAKLNVILGKDHDAIPKSAWEQIVGIANCFISADRYHFAVPMWKGGVPYRLKQYIDELRFAPMLLTNDPAGDLERTKKDAARLAQAHGRVQTIKS